MKKFINDIPQIVPDMLDGLEALNPDVTRLGHSLIILRRDAREKAKSGKVALISGGGSGHEPAHGGYVGPGMLSAAVAGEIFASPSADAVLDAIRAVAGPAGVLLIVKNYTGDRLNFGLAAELARAEGIKTDMVTVADDVALSTEGRETGRRGLAGTVFVHKIAGAAAEAGASLAEVARVARAAASALGTMGVALTSCTVPSAGKPGFALGEDEIEWGLGIHGEPGAQRGALQPARALVQRLLAHITRDLSLVEGERVALLVNNLGATPPGEMDIVTGVAIDELRAYGVQVERAWAGAFLSALDMRGISLTLLRLDDEILSYLDAPARAAAWPALSGRIAARLPRAKKIAPETSSAAGAEEEARLSPETALRSAIEEVCRILLDAEAALTEMDQRVGDGDLGVSLSRAARTILERMDHYPPADRPGAVLRAMAADIRRVVGGTSGPLYAVLLVRAANELDAGAKPPVLSDWSRAFMAGVEGVMTLGGAKLGDRTMVDALHPAACALQEASACSLPVGKALEAAAWEAKSGAMATADMNPRRGRSSYMGKRALGFVDPGAHAVSLWMTGICAFLHDRFEAC